MNATVKIPSAMAVRSEADITASTQQTSWLVADVDGRILVVASTPYFMMEMHVLEAGQRKIQGAGDSSKDWLNGGIVQPRPANPSTLDGMKISNVPNPSTVTIGTETSAEVTDGEVELEFTQPGTFTVRIQGWPYLDAVFTVTADEATT